MKTKHTKGEWMLNKYGAIVDSNNKAILCGGLAIPMQPTEESIANSKLIAAAPELLEALISVIESTKPVFLDNRICGYTTSNLNESLLKAINAINKATK